MAIRGLPQTIPELVSEAGTLLRQGRLAEAANLYQHILEREPGNLNALHLYGVLALQAGNPQQAIEHIERAIRVDASRAPIHFNLGNAYLQAGQVDNAVSAYRRALGIDNGMAAAWCGLGTALTRSGDYADALAAAGQALQLEPDSIAALGCIAAARQKAGDTAEALASYARALEIAPDNAELLSGAGFAHYELGQYEEAAQLCRQATRLAPEYGLAYFNLGLALTECGRLAAACKALTRATQLLPGSALCHNALGRAELLRGRHQDALQEFTRATQLQPESESAHNNRGLALQRLGDAQGASHAYEQALAVNPGYVDAWLNLVLGYEQSNRLDEADAAIARGLEALGEEPALTLMAVRLQRRRGEPGAAMERLEQLPVPDLSADLQRQLLFERGRLANALEQEDEAFRCIAQANQLSRQSPAGVYFRQQNYGQEVQALARGMAGNWADDWQAEHVDGDDAPVFLIGFPRSGTTLLEQLLSGHPDVVAMEEQALIARAGQQLASREGEYPALLGALPAGQRQALREEYLQQARTQVGWQPGQLLLDKLPLNTIHLPLIHCLFPDARLLLALRHPCDVALSCFMQDFELNEAMVNFTSLADTAQLYDAVMSICHSARQQLPLRVHEVRYENLVDKLEHEARALLQFLGLDWHDQVLDFVTTAAAKTRIQTPSYEQVSQPLYREARLRWQRYRSHLAAIEPLLQPHCDRLGYSL